VIHLNNRRVFLCRMPVDMRKSYDTLADVVRIELGMDPFLGDVFIFLGRDRTRLKTLIWESDGFWLCTKRLESAKFGVLHGWGTTSDASTTLSLTNAQVTALLRELVPRPIVRSR